MCVLIGREEELSQLNRFCDYPYRKACAVFGIRHTGKSALIKEFIKDREHIVFGFVDSTTEVNLRMAGRVMSQRTGTEKEYRTSFDFVWDLADYIKGKKMIIVFDEFPHMLKCDDSFAGIVKHFIDMQLGDSKLIMTGSSVSVMHYEMTDYSRPLYGRAELLYLDELPFADCIGFHPHLSDIDQIRMYLTAGGFPIYHRTDEKTYREYIENRFLSQSASFRNEAENIIFGEFSPGRDFVMILDSIGERKVTVAEIVSKTGIDRNTCARYLNAMKELNLISECIPMWDAPKKPKYYTISDGIMALRFIAMRYDVSYSSDPHVRFDAMNEGISAAHSLMFRKFCEKIICKSYCVTGIGSWWGKEHGTEEDSPNTEYGIDIAAEVKVGNNTVDLAVGCVFTDNPAGINDLRKLENAISHFRTKRHPREMLISPSGFTEDLKEYAIDNNILLVNADMLLGRSPMPQL